MPDQPDQNQEIYFVILIGIVLALTLVGFIVIILFLYQRRQHRQEKQLAEIKVLVRAGVTSIAVGNAGIHIQICCPGAA